MQTEEQKQDRPLNEANPFSYPNIMYRLVVLGQYSSGMQQD